jgi:hypothetical protein
MLFEICALINVLWRLSWINNVSHWFFGQTVKDLLTQSGCSAVRDMCFDKCAFAVTLDKWWLCTEFLVDLFKTFSIKVVFMLFEICALINVLYRFS